MLFESDLTGQKFAVAGAKTHSGESCVFVGGEIPVEMYESEERTAGSTRFAEREDLTLGENKCATLS